MKNTTTTAIITGIVTITFLVPAMSSAHTGEESSFDSYQQTPMGMMMYMEEETLGSENHEEMEELMEKMFAGELSEEEANRLEGFMSTYPEGFNTMFNRMHYRGDIHDTMMPMGWIFPGHNSWPAWVAGLTWLIWLTAGVLLLIVLIKNLAKKNNK